MSCRHKIFLWEEREAREISYDVYTGECKERYKALEVVHGIGSGPIASRALARSQ